MKWFSRLSLRARLMTIGVAGLAIALAVTSAALYMVLRTTVNSTLGDAARAGANDVSTLIDRGEVPDPIPVSGAQVIQVLDTDHRVIAGSATADRLTPLLHPDELEKALDGSTIVIPGNRAGLSSELRVIAVSAGPASKPDVVLVAVQTADVTGAVRALRHALLFSYPVVLAVLSLIAWYVVGWTLRPVEAMRAGAERISGAGRSERLPVPESRDEIRALALTLNSMLDRLSVARGRQRAFVADAAHELRSPLTNIRAQLEIAERLGEGGDLPSELLVDVDRLSSLVEDLLLLARADADTRGPVAAREFDVRELLQDIAASYGGRRVPVVVAGLPPGLLLIVADREELRRALTNLVDNAVRHADACVRLTAVADVSSVTLSVSDDGPGIAAADRERVFERFTRLDDARDRDVGGSGLGLAIARELVRRAGGNITLAERRPSGITARIILQKGQELPVAVSR